VGDQPVDRHVPFASGALPLIMRLLAIVLATLALRLIYIMIPARRVPVRAALVGALSTSIAFDAATRTVRNKVDARERHLAEFQATR
jgi:uncharacterized BrkB/YihY/UPF0761 family membrane protein